MKRFLLPLVAALVCNLNIVGYGQSTQQRVMTTTSQFAREALTNETADAWRAKLGVGTNGLGPVASTNLTGTVTNAINSTQIFGIGPNSYDLASSNYVGGGLVRASSLIAGYDPIGNAEASNGITILQFGDSTVEQPQSPANDIARKFTKRYGFGGWVSDGATGNDPVSGGGGNGIKLVSETSGPWNFFFGMSGIGSIWAVTNGGTGLVIQSNNQTTPCPTFGQSWSAITTGGMITWTNDYLNGAANPDGALPGMTRLMVFYTMTNGLGTFNIQTNINSGGWGTAVTVNCSQTAGVAQVATNASLTLSSVPNTNRYMMRVVGASGMCIINFAGMWNDFAGTKIIKFSRGGWQLARLWTPTWDGGTWPNPVTANSPSMDNLMNSIPAPGLTLASVINRSVNDDNFSNLGTFTTHTNLQAELTWLSAEFNKYSPLNLTVWYTVAPSAQNWQYQPEAFRDIFNDPFNTGAYTGHDYVYYSMDNTTPDRYNFALDGSAWPHWSWAGGYYVANGIMDYLYKVYDPQAYRLPVYSPTVNGATMGSYGIDLTNGSGTFGPANNYGYSLSLGGDFGSTGSQRTVGTTKSGIIGYPTANSTVPNAALLTFTTDSRPVTTFEFGGLGPNGQAFNYTNLFMFRNANSDIWQIGGAPAADGSAGPGRLLNANSSIVLDQDGSIATTTIKASLTNSKVEVTTNLQVDGSLNVNGTISESSPGGWVYFSNPDGTLVRSNLITGAVKYVSVTGNDTNNGFIFSAGFKTTNADSYWVAPGPTNAGTGTTNGFGTRLAPFTGDFDNIITNLPGPCTINLLPGTYWTKGSNANVFSGQIIRGSGIDVTIVKRDTNFWPNGTCVFQQQNANAGNIEISDMTLDCNARGNETNAINAIVIYGTNNLVKRVKAINSSGNWPNNECFTIYLSVLAPGDGTFANNRILDCEVNQMLGNYTEAFFLGSHGAVAGNKATMPLNTSNAVPPFINGYQFNNSVNALLFNNTSSGGNIGFYTDTGIETNITIANNSFNNCRLGVHFSKTSAGTGVWGANITGNKIVLASGANSGSGSVNPAGIYIQPNGSAQTLYNIKIKDNTIRYQNDTLTTPNIWNAISVSTNSGGLAVSGNTIATNMTMVLSSMANPVLTPWDFGAQGLPFNDAIPVSRCEGVVEGLIAQGLPFQSSYDGPFNIGTLVITNKCNIKGSSLGWSGNGFNTAVPTFISSAATAVQFAWTNSGSAGLSIQGIYVQGNTNSGSIGLSMYVTNSNLQNFKVNDCVFSGFDTCIAATNLNDGSFEDIYINGTNGFVSGFTGAAGNGSQAWNQQLTIKHLRGNVVKTAMILDGTGAPNVGQITVDGMDVATTATNAYPIIIRTNVNVAFRGCNIEGTSLRYPFHNFYIDNSSVRVEGGTMNLGTNACFIVTNSGSWKIARKPLLAGDLNSVASYFASGSDPYASGSEDNEVSLKATNVAAGTTLTITGGNRAFDVLTVAGNGASSVVNIQNGTNAGALNLGADSGASTLTANVGKAFAARFPGYGTTTYDNNFFHLNSGTGSTSQINFGGNDSDASSGNAPNTYYFHAINGGGAAGPRSFGINQYGFESFGTNSLTYTNVSGWTNAFNLIVPWEVDVQAYVSGSSGLTVLSVPANNTVVFSINGTYTNVPVSMGPGWGFRGTGITGVSVAAH